MSRRVILNRAVPPISARQRAKRVLDSGPGWRLDNALGPDGATLTIYDEIGMWGIMAQDVIMAVQQITAPSITVRVNSPGGDVFDGIAIKNALQAHSARIDVIVDGHAASIASVICMAGDTVTMMPGAQMMIHNASGFVYGDAEDMAEMARLLEAQNVNIANIYQARAGGTADEWLARMDATTWYSDTQAVEVGLADTVAARDGGPTDLKAVAALLQSATAAIPESIQTSVTLGSNSHVSIGCGHTAAFTAGHKPPVKCGCVPAPVATLTDLIKLDHHDDCPLSAHAANTRAANGVMNFGIMMDWVLGDGGVAGNCDVCQDLADNGPYEEDDLPDCPAHPNCDCWLQIAIGAPQDSITPTSTPAQTEPVLTVADFRTILTQGMEAQPA